MICTISTEVRLGKYLYLLSSEMSVVGPDLAYITPGSLLVKE